MFVEHSIKLTKFARIMLNEKSAPVVVPDVEVNIVDDLKIRKEVVG